ncbi:Renin receptor-like protein [Aphelenchoides fujianensis]|nr:Renin receptor-like protein [Aphelenchoides fujianensis]
MLKWISALLLVVAAVFVVEAADGDDPLMTIRKQLNVYSFTSPDYPAAFAIVAGVSLVLAIAVIFIVVGLLSTKPPVDSIIYRMTTVRQKRD